MSADLLKVMTVTAAPATAPDTLVLTRPDDWHLHVRDGAAMASVVPATAHQFARAIVMPNLRPPITTAEAAAAYRDRILAALPAGLDFQPLMTLYLTDSTPPEEIDRAMESGVVFGAKLYPAGATTNSHSGVRNFDRVMPVLETMAGIGLPLWALHAVLAEQHGEQQEQVEDDEEPVLQQHGERLDSGDHGRFPTQPRTSPARCRCRPAGCRHSGPRQISE